jgi:hypothetical protein
LGCANAFHAISGFFYTTKADQNPAWKSEELGCLAAAFLPTHQGLLRSFLTSHPFGQKVGFPAAENL